MLFAVADALPDPTRLWVSRAVFVAAILALALLALIFRRRTASTLTDFFTAKTSPINLAIFRIVVFTFVFFDLGNDANPAIINFYSTLPATLQIPPPGWGPILKILPVNPQWAEVSLALLSVFSLFAAVGFFSRISAWGVVIAGLYVLGIPQYFGKVNHTHHTLWFAAILAASRCGDAWSVDALVRRRIAKRQGVALATPAPAVAYALPLRAVWIVIGLIYFFPGFWKLWHCGIDWAWSDNFKYQMYTKWHQLGGWRPSIRLDQYPLLYKLGALGAMVFELSFVFLILFRRSRPIAALMGLSFHIGTRVLMKIGFWSLVIGYITFVDWEKLLRRFGYVPRSGSEPVATPPRVPWGVIATFAVLFFGNVAFGLAEARDGWPLTCYPPFSKIEKPYIQTVDVVVRDKAGKEIDWNESALKDRFSKSRYAAMMERFAKTRDPEKLQAFWTVLARQDAGFARARTVEFFNVKIDTSPEAKKPEVDRELIWTAHVGAGS